jgi:hypothetical protein
LQRRYYTIRLLPMQEETASILHAPSTCDRSCTILPFTSIDRRLCVLSTREKRGYTIIIHSLPLVPAHFRSSS